MAGSNLFVVPLVHLISLNHVHPPLCTWAEVPFWWGDFPTSRHFGMLRHRLRSKVIVFARENLHTTLLSFMDDRTL